MCCCRLCFLTWFWHVWELLGTLQSQHIWKLAKTVTLHGINHFEMIMHGCYFPKPGPTNSLASLPASAVFCKLLILRVSSFRYLSLPLTSSLRTGQSAYKSSDDKNREREIVSGGHLRSVLIAFFRLLRRPLAILLQAPLSLDHFKLRQTCNAAKPLHYRGRSLYSLSLWVMQSWSVEMIRFYWTIRS